MTVALLCPMLTLRSFLNTGLANAFGTLTTYQAGGSTPIATYVDSTGTTTNNNPITLNARGEANVWLLPNTAYKFVEADQFGNLIKTTDQVNSQQLLTLFGGVDTGSTNAYIVNYQSNFTSLTNGIIVYFLPSNTNTGSSTLNVNGLGAQAILNPNGSALSAGEIVSGQSVGVLYYNGNWLLISSSGSIPLTGTFSATVTGGSNAPLTCAYSINGSSVNVNLPYCAFTSTANTFTLTGLPAALQPASQKVLPLAVMQNNGAYIETAGAWLGPNGTITFINAASAAGWTAAGVKGIGFLSGATQIGVTLAYNLS